MDLNLTFRLTVDTYELTSKTLLKVLHVISVLQTHRLRADAHVMIMMMMIMMMMMMVQWNVQVTVAYTPASKCLQPELTDTDDHEKHLK